MKRIIRLTESDLTRIVRRVIMEQATIDPTISQALDNLQKQFESMIGLVVSKYPEQEGYAEMAKKELSEDIINLKNLSGKFDDFKIIKLLSYKNCYGYSFQGVNQKIGFTVNHINNALEKDFQSTPQNVKKVVQHIERLITKLQEFQFLK
jgi:hypothetical protein